MTSRNRTHERTTAVTDTTRDFIDHWDTFTDGDLAHDFAEAVDSARWGDDPEGGTLANKSDAIPITEEVLGHDEAQRLARELLDANDPRIADPHGPAGAIPITPGDNGAPAWILFGRSPVAPFPPCRDDIASQLDGFPPRCDEWLPVATAAQNPRDEYWTIYRAANEAALADTTYEL
jgi:hypothetical protein